MKSYETVIIFKPQLNDDQIKSEIERLESYLKEHGAQKVTAEPWGRRELAFEMNKCNYGVYYIFKFECADGDVISAVNSICRINDGIVKFQTHRLGSAERGFKGNPKLLEKYQARQAAAS